MKDRIKDIYHKLIKSYRISVYDLKSLTELFSRQFSPMIIIFVLLSIFVLAVFITVIVIIYTPAKRALPGYPSKQMSQMIVHNANMLDSLEYEIEMRDKYLEKIQSVINGEIIKDTLSGKKKISFQDVEMEPMSSDSIFENLISPEKYKFSYSITKEEDNLLSGVNFFPPVRGIIVNKFNDSPGHYGTDIVAPFNSPVCSSLPGTVIFAEWSISTGYVVHIQHDHNLITVYKHNNDVVVKPGERVSSGQVIGFVGNEGELSTGPHLHFEMWHNGKPLDSEKYVYIN
ncbi:MAG: M23 family metallopeptidase [Prolixibacteraceae bacterium]|nr:M23 family metallopeptidase [Prolixibacteraceae bacterium]